MSYFGIVFLMAFTGNVVLDALFGAEDAQDRKVPPKGEAAAVVFLGLIAGLISALVSWIMSLLDAEHATAPVVVILVFLASRGIEEAAKRFKPGSAPRTAETMMRVEASALAYAIGIIVAGSGMGGLEAIIAGLAASGGYFAATAFLRKIMARASLEDLPQAFRGKPILFINAGILALAFSALDGLASFLIGRS